MLLDLSLQFSLILAMGLYLGYAMVMKATAHRPPVSSGLSLCYGYPSWLSILCGMLHFVLLAGSIYLTVFIKLNFIFIITFLPPLLLMHYVLIRGVRELFSRIYFFRDLIIKVYPDWRYKEFYFDKFDKVQKKRFLLIKAVFITQIKGNKSFLCLTVLRSSKELEIFVMDRVNFFKKQLKISDDEN
jgi:hypothetical protein